MSHIRSDHDGEVCFWHLADIDLDAEECPLCGRKRTSGNDAPMSANDPKRTSRGALTGSGPLAAGLLLRQGSRIDLSLGVPRPANVKSRGGKLLSRGETFSVETT